MKKDTIEIRATG